MKSGKQLYETFFVGEEGTQYFIKPLTFEAQGDPSLTLELDIAFRSKKELKGKTTLNYSLLGSDIVKSVEKISLNSSPTTVLCEENKFLFNEKKKKHYVSRFSSELEAVILKELFKKAQWEIHLESKEQNYVFVPSAKTAKAIAKLNENVFVLF